jgi:NADH dehydrogenase
MTTRHHVVIVGGGFVGLRVAQTLARTPVDITLIDRRNHHLFQPLLYQVATGALSPADIAVPIRGLLARQRNVRVLLAEATGLDATAQELHLADGETLAWDTLVVATGVTHSYFGHPEWAPLAPGLKTLEDATDIRRRILLAFEGAERATDEEERRAWLTFVIVGAGPTGVEMAGSLGEMAGHTLRHDFRACDPGTARILLVEGGERILAPYDAGLATHAAKSLTDLGVTVRPRTLVTDVRQGGVTLKGPDGEEDIAARTVLWAAGVASSPLGKVVAEATDGEVDRLGRMKVEGDLTVPGHPQIFVAGDLSSCEQDGAPLRGTADVAQAEGAYIGRLIQTRLQGRTLPRFRFRDFGKLAVVGRSSAIAELKAARFRGLVAWLFWLFVHLMKLVDFQNRLTVFFQWGWSYLTRKRSARLITGELPPPFSSGETNDGSGIAP